MFDPEYFGAPPLAAPPPPARPLAEYRLMRPFADPDLFWVLMRGEAWLGRLSNRLVGLVVWALRVDKLHHALTTLFFVNSMIKPSDYSVIKWLDPAVTQAVADLLDQVGWLGLVGGCWVVA